MKVRELIEQLSWRDSEMDVMIVREDDRSDWANIDGFEVHHDPLDDDGESPMLIILAK